MKAVGKTVMYLKKERDFSVDRTVVARRSDRLTLRAVIRHVSRILFPPYFDCARF